MKRSYQQSITSFGKMKSLGFTIIELMIVVLVIGVLATIAFPSYQRASAKSDRSVAIADINDISQALERYYTYNRVYTNDFSSLRMANNATFALPDPTGRYTYMIGVPNTTAVGAVPQGATTGQSYVIYAAPLDGSRDTWTLSQDYMGFQQSYAEGSTTPVTGWPD